MRILLNLALVVAMAGAGPAFAEELSKGKAEALIKASGPDADARAGMAASAFAVTADGDKTAVSVTVTRSWEATGDALAVKNLAVKFSAPFDKNNGEGNFLTGSGLNASTALEVTYGGLIVRGGALPTSERSLSTYTTAEENCHKAEAPALWGDLCDKKTFNEIKKYLSESQRADFADEAFLNSPLWLWGISASLGHDEFEHRDLATFAKASTTRTPYGASIQGGVVPNHSLVYLGGGLEFKQEYADAKARTLCRPLPAGSPLECFTASYAGPQSQRTLDVFGVIRAETRQFYVPLGLEVKAAYDFERQIPGAVASLYAVSDKDKRLRGGLRFAWQADDDDPVTDDDNFTVGVFIGAAFSAFPTF